MNAVFLAALVAIAWVGLWDLQKPPKRDLSSLPKIMCYDPKGSLILSEFAANLKAMDRTGDGGWNLEYYNNKTVVSVKAPAKCIVRE